MLGKITRGIIASTALAAGLLSAAASFAGQQYIDQTGYAVSGYDVVAYRSLPSMPIGQLQTKAIPGNKDITADWNGVKWAFATTANRDKFLSNPAYYVPRYDGHCAYGAAQGGKVPGNPNLWRIIDDKLYLNITTNVVGFWEEDIAGNLVKSERNWIDLEAKMAANRPVPQLDTSNAPG